jgi:hypothetical protein
MPHHFVVWDGMGLLEVTQEEDRGSLATYVQDFNCMLTMVPLKDVYARKLIFLHALKPWVRKIVYQKNNISNMCQDFMKMVECIKNEAMKSEVKSPRRMKQTEATGKVCNKHKWGQGKLGLQNNKEKLMNKEPPAKKAKWDLSKVKCFNCDNNKHLAKDYLKPPWVSECIAQGKLILQIGSVAKTKAHKSEASNLLKLNCKLNDEIVGCLLNSGTTNSFMTLHAAKQL